MSFEVAGFTLGSSGFGFVYEWLFSDRFLLLFS